MIRVTELEATIRFYALIDLKVVQCMESERGRYTLIFLAADKDIGAQGEISAAEIELIYNWNPQEYRGDRNLGRLGYRVVAVVLPELRLLGAGDPAERW
jgi:lactoylglutathione lyase